MRKKSAVLLIVDTSTAQDIIYFKRQLELINSQAELPMILEVITRAKLITDIAE